MVSINYVNAQEEISDGNDFSTLLEEMQLSEILRQGIEKLPNRKKKSAK